MTVDLDAYFARINYTGPRTPTLSTLRALHALHPAAIPFENLSPLLGQEVKLDLESIQNKLVKAGRGGYCFEHGHLFQAVLRALGFETRPIAARVVWGPPSDVLPPRAHMLLLVTVDGASWIADVGFGGVTLSAPLHLTVGQEQETLHELCRLDALDNGEYLLQVKLGEQWAPVYRFDLVAQCDADYAVSNFFVSAHPESLFVNNLLAARIGKGIRYALFNTQLSTYDPAPSHRDLTSVAELRDVLETIFGIRLPDRDGMLASSDLDAALARCLPV